jgi:LacI family transcriptional regulator
MAKLGIVAPKDVAFANLSLIDKKSSVSGIFERARNVGACAVDLVVQQIQQNILGVPDIPKSIHIEGEWVDGKTL